MYGSAGTYSAGSVAFGGHVRSASIGSGMASAGNTEYEFNTTPIGVGAVIQGQWGVFTDIVPIGSGLGVDAERVIGAITKSASIGLGSSMKAIAGIEFTVTPIGGGLGVNEPSFVLAASASIGMGSAIEVDRVIGTISFELTAIGSGAVIDSGTREITLTEVPKFFLKKSGTTIDITVTNRGQKEIKLYRSDQHNKSFTEITEFASDTYQETVSSGSSPKYKLAFFIDLSPQIVGQKSISKYSK